MSVRIRQGAETDAGAIATILSDWIDETAWMPRIHTRQEDRAFGAFLLEKTAVTVAVDGTSVVGFMACRGTEIEALYLARNARGNGHGSALIQHAKAAHNQLGLWCFAANLRAHAFYARHGFVEVERSDGSGNDEKLPDIRFKWSAPQT